MANNGTSPDYRLLRNIYFNTRAVSLKFQVNNPVEQQLADLANKYLLLCRNYQDAFAYKNYILCRSINSQQDNIIYKMNRIRQQNWYWKPLKLI